MDGPGRIDPRPIRTLSSSFCQGESAVKSMSISVLPPARAYPRIRATKANRQTHHVNGRGRREARSAQHQHAQVQDGEEQRHQKKRPVAGGRRCRLGLLRPSRRSGSSIGWPCRGRPTGGPATRSAAPGGYRSGKQSGGYEKFHVDSSLMQTKSRHQAGSRRFAQPGHQRRPEANCDRRQGNSNSGSAIRAATGRPRAPPLMAHAGTGG